MKNLIGFGIVLLIVFTHPGLLFGLSLKPDETIIFFPTFAQPLGKGWSVPIHGIVFELETNSAWRNAFIKQLADTIGVKPLTDESRRFHDRTAMFLVDNQGWKKIKIKICGRIFQMKSSEKNGHFETRIEIASEQILPCVKKSRIRFTALTPPGDKRIFSGMVFLPKKRGISIISDIDDTIKISNVLDKKELMRNTFLREFEAVPKMERLYMGWSDQGALFHYLSGSPWQLYPFLSEFIKEKGFPEGSFHLRRFRLKDSSFIDMFKDPESYKIPRIEALFDALPEHDFVLVGDSGEKDPEVYGALARRYPGKILHIFIRNVRGDLLQEERLTQAFSGIPRNRWTIFTDPEIIPLSLDEIAAKNPNP